jgi:hypothetical protein
MLGGASTETLWIGVEYCLDSAEKMGINTQIISQYINLFQQSSYNWWGIDNTETATETELPDIPLIHRIATRTNPQLPANINLNCRAWAILLQLHKWAG